MAIRRSRKDEEPFIFPHQMTAQERQALRDAQTPDAILQKLQDGGSRITATTMAFKKTAAQFRAEAEMYEEALRADVAKESFTRRLDLEKTLEVLQQEVTRLERDNKKLHTQLGQATAARAAAIESRPTR